MSDTIFIHQARFPCHIGVTPEERATPQDVLIDLDLAIDLSTAGVSDSIKDTLDYRDVWEATRECVSSHEVHLVEALATRIGNTILERFAVVQSVSVTLTKPRALAAKGVTGVGVRLTVERQHGKREPRS
ncbi:MAG: dihydroneopterin aldolase [Chloroflexi bacterium]|nr:dihydroneopterin aldolase [Chloroflexota bacterium]MDA1174605.1 dihydroneopterin aldolase [Chloroflexota bacterium]